MTTFSLVMQVVQLTGDPSIPTGSVEDYHCTEIMGE